MTNPATALIRAAPATPARPIPRHVLTPTDWQRLPAALAAEPTLTLQALWADATHIHALFLDDAPLLACTQVEAGLYAALSPARPGAALFERTIADLWGHHAADALDFRPWLDHGHWPNLHPLSPRPVPHTLQPDPYEYHAATAAQLPVGPIRDTIAEPAHLRLTASGETLQCLEARLGYAHKGTLLLMRDKSPRAAARFAARLSGDSTVAHSIAFAHAVEAALDTPAPPRAAALRAVMAELERIANHLADIAAACEATRPTSLPARLHTHREALRRAADAAFGHRLMMDLVIPGGTLPDLATDALLPPLHALDADLPRLARAYHRTLSHHLAGIATLTPALIAAYAPGGPIARAAGRAFDLRRALPYPPYSDLPIAVATLPQGDADARLRLRLAEIATSVTLLRTLLAAHPDTPFPVPLPLGSGEGLGWAEAASGDAWHWVRLDGGAVASAFARDPAWLHWPLLEAAAAGTPRAGLPLLFASINPSVSGMDL